MGDPCQLPAGLAERFVSAASTAPGVRCLLARILIDCFSFLKRLSGKKSRLEHGNSSPCGSVGWLLIFDQREAVSWDERLYWREEAYGGAEIRVAGL